MPKLSIITINRNNASGLQTTIKSVLSQTFNDYEYIIMDGNSTDESVAVIKEFGDSITYWESKPDNGRYHAMNKGIKKATGTYCLFLNSGDYLCSANALRKVFDSTFDEELVYTNLIHKNRHGERIRTFPGEITFYWMYTQYLGHASTLIKKDLFEKIGLYSEEYDIVSDWEFFLLAICKYQCSLKYMDMEMSVLVEGGISNHPATKQKVLTEREVVLKKHFRCFYEDYKRLYDLEYNAPSKKLKRTLKNIIPDFLLKTIRKP